MHLEDPVQFKKPKLDCDQDLESMEGNATLDTKALNKFSRQNAALGKYICLFHINI